MSYVMDEMAALRAAKKELRDVVRKRLADVSEGSVAEQCMSAALATLKRIR